MQGSQKRNTKENTPTELNNRMYNLEICKRFYQTYHVYLDELEKESKRFGINNTCLNEMKSLKDFINRTGGSYEAFGTEKL